jgi:hypothetical protein
LISAISNKIAQKTNFNRNFQFHEAINHCQSQMLIIVFHAGNNSEAAFLQRMFECRRILILHLVALNICLACKYSNELLPGPADADRE